VGGERERDAPLGQQRFATTKTGARGARKLIAD
jgi:hypothetical protein